MEHIMDNENKYEQIFNELKQYKNDINISNIRNLDDLEKIIISLIRDATKIIPKGHEKPLEDSHLKSHFGGQPYFENGEKWPSKKEGDNLEFILQIFNTGNINIPENIKLIQFYFDFENSPKRESGFVKIYEQINKNNSIIIKKPEWHSESIYCEIEYEAIKSLPDIDMLVYNYIVKKLNIEIDFRSQLGGYHKTLQNDVKPNNNDFQLLFQIDSEEEVGWIVE